MILSDDELNRWWLMLSKQRQREILEAMVEKSRANFQDFAQSLKDRWDQNISFSPKQLAIIKKWDR